MLNSDSWAEMNVKIHTLEQLRCDDRRRSGGAE